MNKLAIILISVILLLVYGLLAMDYLKQGPEQERLLSEIEDTNLSREALPGASSDFSGQLAAIQAALAAENDVIPAEIDSSDVIDSILSLAQASGVDAIPLVTQSWSEEYIGDNIYRVFRLNIEVEGLFSQVRDYVSRLESGEISTLIIENLTIDVDSDEEYSGGATPVMASLDLAVYTQS